MENQWHNTKKSFRPRLEHSFFIGISKEIIPMVRLRHAAFGTKEYVCLVRRK
jgi:hypothetical protein